MSARPSQTVRSESAVVAAPQTLSITTDDGFPLSATLFHGRGDGPAVLVSSATAVPQGFYAAFAGALVAAGASAALTYDYRGVGRSVRPPSWRRRIGKKEWALRDFPAALAALRRAAPDRPLVGVGQSFGGQALGISGVADAFDRYGMVATMSGYWRGLDDRMAGPRMFAVGVPMSLFFADTPRWLGIGEPIPSSVFRDWARWCRMPGYFFDDPTFPETARYADVTTPILALGLTDDVWGTRRAVDALMRRYSNAPVERRWLSPADAGGHAIGHLGFFRSRFAPTLWPEFIGWLLSGKPMRLGEKEDG
jgi:predicted alpha/beta hydrolase